MPGRLKMSITERFMGFFKSYPSTRHFLGGVIKDFKALQDLTERVGEQWDTFLLLDRDLRTLETGLLFVDPSILWMCGHGKLVDNENVFLIEPPRTNVSDATVLSGTRLTDFLKRTARRTVLYVFDFCHSCTMINLKYYYEDDVYLEKV